VPVPWQRGHAGPKGTAVVHGSISASNVAKEEEEEEEEESMLAQKGISGDLEPYYNKT